MIHRATMIIQNKTNDISEIARIINVIAKHSDYFDISEIARIINVIAKHSDYFDISEIARIINVIAKHSDYFDFDSMSHGQIQSKVWLINELSKLINNDKIVLHSPPIIFLMGGWYAILSLLLFNNLKTNINKIRSFDIDSYANEIAKDINREYVKDDWKFISSTADMFDLDYTNTEYTVTRYDGSTCQLIDSPDIIINTSCEHIQPFEKWFNLIPKDKTIILQSNNLKHPEHINTVESLKEFEQHILDSEILYSGELYINKGNYTRYMIICKR